jgi:hypothetical protein
MPIFSTTSSSQASSLGVYASRCLGGAIEAVTLCISDGMLSIIWQTREAGWTENNIRDCMCVCACACACVYKENPPWIQWPSAFSTKSQKMGRLTSWTWPCLLQRFPGGESNQVILLSPWPPCSLSLTFNLQSHKRSLSFNINLKTQLRCTW